MILVIGAGVAGITCAIEAATAGLDVMLVTPGVLSADGGGGSDGAGAADVDSRVASSLALAGGNTALAQGGIAAAIGASDRPALHADDTVLAGAGLVDAAAAELLTSQGAAAVSGLISQGFGVDRDASGAVSFGLEAAHSRARIVHAGEDRTGAALHTFLRARLLALVAEGRVQLAEQATAVSLLGDSGTVTGAVLRSENGARGESGAYSAGGKLSAVRADAVVLATGGYAALYPETSNHSGARGEGIVLAARLGAVVADLEFVQFHPTVLAGTGFLISEALRGAGAVLRDERGNRFMREAHPAAELAPRDVVSRHVHRSMRASGAAQVWLDASAIEREGGHGTLARRFPAITGAVRAAGIDWTRELVPVAPAAHYTMGGIVTDLHGRTSLPGLFAVGEVACTGVHGANRLASNSLLEGLVFGPRAARAAATYVGAVIGAGAGTAAGVGAGADAGAIVRRSGGMRSAASLTDRTGLPGRGGWEMQGGGARELIARAESLGLRIDPQRSRAEAMHLQGSTAAHLTGSMSSASSTGSTRSASDRVIAEAVAAGLGIERDADGLHEVSRAAAAHSGIPAELAGMIAEAATARTESRGAHQRSDYPETDPAAIERRAWQLGSSNQSNQWSSAMADSGDAPGGAARGALGKPGAQLAQTEVSAFTEHTRSALAC